jgi:hypothetical protein
VTAVGNRKNVLVLDLIRTQGVEAYDDAVGLLRAARGEGFKTAIVSSSKNCLEVISVGGRTLRDLGLIGFAICPTRVLASPTSRSSSSAR